MDDEILGPVDYLAVEWPGAHATGEGFQLLLDLLERGVVRVLDLEFIAKAADGSVRKVALADVEHGGDVDVTMWDGASIRPVGPVRHRRGCGGIEPGSLAGILVYENLWAVPLMTTLDRSTARMVGSGRVVVEDLLATALDETVEPR